MRAIILAAGQGTRLSPLTDNKPKCLVELDGKPMLEYQLNALRACGIFDIHIVGGHFAEQLQKYGLKLHFNHRYAETNMVSTLMVADAVMAGDDDLIIAYGDIVYEPRVLQALLDCDAPIALVVDTAWYRYWSARMVDPLADAETLKLTDGNKVTELGKQARSYEDIQGQYTGLIKVRADCVREFSDVWHGMNRYLTYDGKDFENMFMTSFLQYLIDCGWDVRAALVNNGWAEVDYVSDLEIADRFLDLSLVDKDKLIDGAT